METSLVVKWLESADSAGGTDSIPGSGTKIPYILGQLIRDGSYTEACAPGADALPQEKPLW